jgi:TolB-like protein
MKTSQKLFFPFLILLFSLFICTCATTTKANPDEVSLSTAIRMAASRMETRLAEGTKVALINFTSPSQAFSEYVLDELSSVLVNNGHLVVVDRANLDKIRQELGFNMSGEVSDKSMQEIGQMLGAQALVTGSLTSIADLRRVMFKVIMTETAAVAVQHPADIINDRRVQALLAQGGGSLAVAYGGQSNAKANSNTSGNTATQTQTQTQSAKPAQPAGPQNGTYTYYPRLRAMKSGLAADNIFIAQITVTKDFMVIHYCRTATGPFKEGEDTYAPSGFYYPQNFILQDLNNPSRSYNPVDARNHSNGMGRILSTSFNRINSTRFKLTVGPYGENPPFVFEEIVLGEPDQ